MRIFSDTHQGLNRKSHTIKRSREALARILQEKTQEACTKGQPTTAVHVGDLFDKFSNSEEVIIAAAESIKTCDVILAGNHDSLNENDAEGSLDVIGQLLDDTDVIKPTEFDKPCMEYGQLEGMECVFVPHHATQVLFDAAIAAIPQETERGAMRAAFLHCNYENTMTEDSDTTLNLTKAQAEKLLTVCDYVFIGHEHISRELLNGRLIIVGSIHPTSFSDISDKYYWDLTPEELKKTQVWSQASGYARIEYDGKIFKAIPDAQFIEICGLITSDMGADLAEYISECWENQDRLMVRNNVSFVIAGHQSTEAVDFHTLPDEISKQLSGTELQKKWDHYRGLVEC